MAIRLLPRDEQFFELFTQIAERAVEVAKLLGELLGEEGARRTYLIETISRVEREADQLTHDVTVRLDRSFITPLDREDIHALIKTMDDVLDFIDAAAQRLYLYEVRVIPEEMHKLLDITAESVALVNRATSMLTDLKNPTELLQLCVDINRLENDADVVLRGAVARLFREEQDLRLLIKLKEIYELLETVTDRCEDVANLIESIVLEYA